MTTFSISLPNQVAKAIDLEYKGFGFASRSEFIRDLIRRFLFESQTFKVFSPRPLEEIKFELTKSGKYSQKFIESVIKGLSKSSLYAS